MKPDATKYTDGSKTNDLEDKPQIVREWQISKGEDIENGAMVIRKNKVWFKEGNKLTGGLPLFFLKPEARKKVRELQKELKEYKNHV